MRLALAALVGFGAGCQGCDEVGGVDAGTPDASLSPDANRSDAADAFGTDAGRSATTFHWDPWPSGPVDYVIEHPRCNYGGGGAGNCPVGFACGEPIDVPFVALTRREPVCVPEAGRDPLSPIELTPPDEATAGDPREVVVRIDGLAGAIGTMRVRDVDGREAYAGPAGPVTRLELAPGPHSLSLTLPRSAELPPWVRSGSLEVDEPGEVTLPIDATMVRVRSRLPVEAALRLRNETTGTVERLDMAPGADVELVVVPGPLSALVQTPLGDFEVRAESGALDLAATIVSVSGEVARRAIDGAVDAARGDLLFVGEVGEPVEVPLRAGTFSQLLVAGSYDVYVDALAEPAPPQSRASLGRFVFDEDRMLALEAREVRLEGELQVDGAPAPSGGETRLGRLQLVDALGVASRGIDVVPGGAFAGTVLATTASVRFTGTRDPLPRLAQQVADAIAIDEMPRRFDASSRALTIEVTADERRLPDGPAELEAPRGEVLVSDGAREVAVAIPRSGPSEVLVHVPAGALTLTYRASGSPFLPEGRTTLGSVEVPVAGARVTHDIALVDLRLRVAEGVVAERLRFRAAGDVTRIDVRPGAGGELGETRVLLFGGTYDVRTVCLGGCGELLHGWLRLP